DHAGAAGVGVDALWLSLAVGLVAAPLLAFGARPIATALGGDGDVLGYAVEYLRISAVGVPFVLVTLGAQGVLRGAANYTTPLVVLACSNVANLLIEVVLVFGLDLGIAGSAWSTVVSQIGAAIAFVVLVRPRLA